MIKRPEIKVILKIITKFPSLTYKKSIGQIVIYICAEALSLTDKIKKGKS